MTDLREQVPVPAPRRYPFWHPPDSKWKGRALFFGSGVAALCIGLWLVGALLGGRTWNRFTYWIPAAVPVGLATWVVVQRVRQGPRWRWCSFVVGVTILPVAVVGPAAIERAIKTRTFDRHVWGVDGLGVFASRRVWMVDDLLERHLLAGRQRVDVESLLGSPDALAPSTGAAVYWLGADRGSNFMFVEYEELWIEYGADDCVVAARVEDR